MVNKCTRWTLQITRAQIKPAALCPHLFWPGCDIQAHYLTERNWEMNLFCDDFIDTAFLFQVRWGGGSIVSVRWVHLDNPRLWECGNGWERNFQTPSSSSSWTIKSISMIWRDHSSLDLALFLSPACFYLDAQWPLDQVRPRWSFEVPSPAFSSLSECHHPHKDFFFLFCLSSLKLSFTHVLWPRTLQVGTSPRDCFDVISQTKRPLW